MATSSGRATQEPVSRLQNQTVLSKILRHGLVDVLGAQYPAIRPPRRGACFIEAEEGLDVRPCDSRRARIPAKLYRACAPDCRPGSRTERPKRSQNHRYAIGLRAAHGSRSRPDLPHIEDIQAEDGIERSCRARQFLGGLRIEAAALARWACAGSVAQRGGGSKGSFRRPYRRVPDQLAGDVSYPPPISRTSSPTWGRIFSCQPAQIWGLPVRLLRTPGRRGEL